MAAAKTQIKTAVSRKQFQLALDLSLDVLAVTPKDVEVLLFAAASANQLGKSADALRHLQTVLSIEPSNVSAYRGLLDVYRATGQHRELAATLDSLRTLIGRDDQDKWVDLGVKQATAHTQAAELEKAYLTWLQLLPVLPVSSPESSGAAAGGAPARKSTTRDEALEKMFDIVEQAQSSETDVALPASVAESPSTEPLLQLVQLRGAEWPRCTAACSLMIRRWSFAFETGQCTWAAFVALCEACAAVAPNLVDPHVAQLQHGYGVLEADTFKSMVAHARHIISSQADTDTAHAVLNICTALLAARANDVALARSLLQAVQQAATAVAPFSAAANAEIACLEARAAPSMAAWEATLASAQQAIVALNGSAGVSTASGVALFGATVPLSAQRPRACPSDHITRKRMQLVQVLCHVRCNRINAANALLAEMLNGSIAAEFEAPLRQPGGLLHTAMLVRTWLTATPSPSNPSDALFGWMQQWISKDLVAITEADATTVATALQRSVFVVGPDTFGVGISAAWEHAGRVLLTQGRVPEAQASFLRAAKQDPTNAYAFAGLGVVYAGNNDMDRATKCWTKSLLLHASNPVAGPKLADFYLSNSQLLLARTLCEAAVEQHAGSRWAWWRLGEIRLHQQDVDASIVAFHKALRLEPGEPGCWNGLARAYVAQGKLAASLKAALRATELAPQYLPYRCTLADVHAKLLLHKEAADDWNVVLAVRPTDVVALHGLAASCLAMSRQCIADGLFGSAVHWIQDGISVVNRGVAAAGTDTVPACLWKLQGDLYCQAYFVCPPLFGISNYQLPGLPAGYQHIAARATLVSGLGACAKAAAQAYANAVAQAPEDGGAWLDLGLCLVYQYRAAALRLGAGSGIVPYARVRLALAPLMELAAATLRQAIQRKPKQLVAAWSALGSVEPRPLYAHYALVQAVRLGMSSGTSGEAWANLGVLFMEQGALSLAKSAFVAAQCADPSLPSVWLGHGFINANAGVEGCSPAFASWLNALELSPNAWAMAAVGLLQLGLHPGGGALKSPVIPVDASAALSALVQSAEMNSMNIAAILGLACAVERTGKPQIASDLLAYGLKSLDALPADLAGIADVVRARQALQLNLARCHLQARNVEEAIAALHGTSINDPHARLYRAAALLMNDRRAASLEELNALDVTSVDWALCVQVAKHRYAAGDTNGAVAALKAATKLEPNALSTWRAAVAMGALSRDEKLMSLGLARLALADPAPGLQSLPIKAAATCLTMDRAAARRLISKALHMNPAGAQGWVELSRVLLGPGNDYRPDLARNAAYAAVFSLTQHVDAQPETGLSLHSLYSSLGATMAATGRPFASPEMVSKRMAARALHCNPSDASLWRAVAAERLGQAVQQRASSSSFQCPIRILQWLSASDDLAKAQLTVAHVAAGHLDAARATCSESGLDSAVLAASAFERPALDGLKRLLLALDGNSDLSDADKARLWSVIAATLVRCGDGGRALKALNVARTLAPITGGLQQSMYQLRSGDARRAVTTADAVNKRCNASSTLHAVRGLAKVAAGQVDKAVAAFKEMDVWADEEFKSMVQAKRPAQ